MGGVSKCMCVKGGVRLDKPVFMTISLWEVRCVSGIYVRVLLGLLWRIYLMAAAIAQCNGQHRDPLDRTEEGHHVLNCSVPAVSSL